MELRSSAVGRERGWKGLLEPSPPSVATKAVGRPVLKPKAAIPPSASLALLEPAALTFEEQSALAAWLQMEWPVSEVPPLEAPSALPALEAPTTVEEPPALEALTTVEAPSALQALEVPTTVEELSALEAPTAVEEPPALEALIVEGTLPLPASVARKVAERQATPAAAPLCRGDAEPPGMLRDEPLELPWRREQKRKPWKMLVKRRVE